MWVVVRALMLEASATGAYCLASYECYGGDQDIQEPATGALSASRVRGAVIAFSLEVYARACILSCIFYLKVCHPSLNPCIFRWRADSSISATLLYIGVLLISCNLESITDGLVFFC